MAVISIHWRYIFCIFHIELFNCLATDANNTMNQMLEDVCKQVQASHKKCCIVVVLIGWTEIAAIEAFYLIRLMNHRQTTLCFYGVFMVGTWDFILNRSQLDRLVQVQIKDVKFYPYGSMKLWKAFTESCMVFFLPFWAVLGGLWWD